MNKAGCYFCLSITLLALQLGACSKEVDDEQVKRTRDFIAAFNDRDAASMAAMVHEQMQWLSIVGANTTVVTSGRDGLLAEMTAYFAGEISTTSRLLRPVREGKYVVGVEAASWQAQSGPRRQCSVVVYEYQGILIRNVWYYPAYPC